MLVLLFGGMNVIHHRFRSIHYGPPLVVHLRGRRTAASQGGGVDIGPACAVTVAREAPPHKPRSYSGGSGFGFARQNIISDHFAKRPGEVGDAATGEASVGFR